MRLAASRSRAGDVLVVAQRDRLEGGSSLRCAQRRYRAARALELAAITGKDARLIELILGESSEVLRAKRDVLIMRHRLGFVMANAGIDRSNLDTSAGGERVLLLPQDPQRSALALRAALGDAAARHPASSSADSFGAPGAAAS